MTRSEREARLLEIGRGLVRSSRADQTEILLVEGRSYLTRFAAGRIHQNVGVEEAAAVVRVAAGKRLGVATASSLEPPALRDALGSALAVARASTPVADWPGLPAPRAVRAVDAWDEATAEADPSVRAGAAGAIIAAARARGGQAAGAVQTEGESVAVVSSVGVEVAASTTRAQMHTVVAAGDGEGYAEGVSTRLSDLGAAKIGRRAARKARAARGAEPIEPGRYDVLLEPPAIAEWIEYLAYIAFGGKDYDEGRSPLAGRLGQTVTGRDVRIWDDALDPRGLPMPFDFEGMPSRRLPLIQRGVARAIATNHYRARRLGKRQSTGHALPASSRYECMPMHLFMGGGTSSKRRLLQETRRGLLITRFHYTNILDPMHTVLTGMTRDGTFLVEDGRIVRPVRNLRYTENILEALGRIDGLSRRLTLARGPVVVPTVRVRGVRFSGATEF